MSANYSNLLRRTFAAVGAGLLIAASLPAASQGTVTLSTGASCQYSQMTVQPNGSISVTCQSTTTPTPGVANFSVTVASTAGAAGSAQQAYVRRTGGPGDTALFVAWAYSGTCTGTNDGIFLVDGGVWTEHFTLGNDGTCTITITAPANHTASPSSASVTVGTAPPPPPPPPPTGPAVPPGCPALPTDAKAGNMADFGTVEQLRMKSGQVAYYTVPTSTPNPPSVAVEFTQGQQGSLPSGTVYTYFTVSRCPGVIDTTVPQCYYKSGPNQVNNNKIKIYIAPTTGLTSQATVADRGCYAPALDAADPSSPRYVNVMWTYGSCSLGTGNCGFSMQWAPTTNY